MPYPDWDTMDVTEQKAVEARFRRAAKRIGLIVMKSRTREPRALDFGRYWLVDPLRNVVKAGGSNGLSIDELEAVLIDGPVMSEPLPESLRTKPMTPEEREDYLDIAEEAEAEDIPLPEQAPDGYWGGGAGVLPRGSFTAMVTDGKLVIELDRAATALLEVYVKQRKDDREWVTMEAYEGLIQGFMGQQGGR